MCAAPKKQERYREIRNSKVDRDYFVEDRMEAGVVLTGMEVKSVREGGAQISDSFVRFEKGLPILYHAHIAAYSHAANKTVHNPYRPRGLLMKKREARKWEMAMQQTGHAVIPLRFYFKKALLKVELGLCKGKKLYDKREDLKKKALRRDDERLLSVR